MDPIIIVFYGALLVVIYFFFIRPQSKKAKEQATFITEIQKGDKIVTTGGIHGRVAKVDDTTFLIEVDGSTKLRVERSAISMEMSKSANAASEKPVEAEKK